MDEKYILNWFSFGTVPHDTLVGKRFSVEKLLGFVDMGFELPWVKVFRKKNGTGYNISNGVPFGEFRIGFGTWRGYSCLELDYGPGFFRVKEYVRQTDPGVFVGVYELNGETKGWYLLKEVVK